MLPAKVVLPTLLAGLAVLLGRAQGDAAPRPMKANLSVLFTGVSTIGGVGGTPFLRSTLLGEGELATCPGKDRVSNASANGMITFFID